MHRAWLPVLLLALMLGSPALGQERGAPGYLPLYGELLSLYTRSVDAEVGTRVNYPGLKLEPRWQNLVQALAAVDPAQLGSREAELAFWINAYNILAIDLVVRHYPVESIRDIGSIFRSVWKREAGRIGGRGYTLDEIEHRILRPMKDPRIHGAIVCASISCPSLARIPYTSADLDAQLEASLRAWLARPEKGLAVDRDKMRIRISRIFKWFDEDFGGSSGVRAFVERYAPVNDQAWLKAHRNELRVSYFDYDWNLNE